MTDAPRKIPYDGELVLFERSVGFVDLDVSAIAAHFGLTADDGSDELDVFQIIILSTGDTQIAFTTHRGGSRGSLVRPVAMPERWPVEQCLASLLGELAFHYQAFEEPW